MIGLDWRLSLTNRPSVQRLSNGCPTAVQRPLDNRRTERAARLHVCRLLRLFPRQLHPSNPIPIPTPNPNPNLNLTSPHLAMRRPLVPCHFTPHQPTFYTACYGRYHSESEWEQTPVGCGCVLAGIAWDERPLLAFIHGRWPMFEVPTSLPKCEEQGPRT